MRKVRDFDTELKALNDPAKLLRSRKKQQFGELVDATGANALEPDLLAGALLAVIAEKDRGITGRGAQQVRNSFARQPGDPRAVLVAAARMAKRLKVERNRLDAARAHADTRAWVVARRERTRHLIELGGLVQNAGLVALAEDDRAMRYGAFLDAAHRMGGDDGPHARTLFKRRAARAFATEAEHPAQAARNSSPSSAAAAEP